MNKEEQDKLYNALSEENKKKYSQEYKECIDDGGETALIERRVVLADIFGSHNLNPKPLTYEDVDLEIFKGKPELLTISYKGEAWRKKIKAIANMLVVAKYLNGDWKPDWNNIQDKWYLAVEKGKIKVDYHDDSHNSHFVYFRTKEFAEQAIQILGEETIRLATTMDY